MIDITQLTQEQQWGLAFAVQQANANIAEDAEPITLQDYADNMFSATCDNYYRQLIDYKTQSALALFNSLSPEQQAALVEQLQIPDVLQ